MLAVSDNGSGMASDILDKVFEPFFTTKGLGQGTGLGLATVYGIVRQNNGFLNVYSEPEQGTTIKVYLSRHSSETVRAHRESPAFIPEGQGETVLLVEDDLSILKLAQTILEKLNYTVLPTASPIEAQSLAAEHAGNIDLLITDVVMPEMNGRELSEHLHSLYPRLETLYMSGYTANVIAHRGVLEEGVSFIPKPLSIKELAVKVREVLDRPA
jgi:two-component system cell cycle sensor histidine kinase/response regulator CckA